MAHDNPESLDQSDEFYNDGTEYMIRRDQLQQKGYSLSFSYNREMATELREHLENTREELRKNGFVVVTVICDKQTALYSKRD